MEEGLKIKYFAKKNGEAELVECFILRPDIDPAAYAALWAYVGETPDEVIKTQIQLTLLRLDGNKAPLPPARRKIDELKTSTLLSHYELAMCSLDGNGAEEADMILALARKIAESKDTLPLEYLVEEDPTLLATRFGINMLLIDRNELMEFLHYKALALKHGLTLDEEVD